MPRSKNTTSTDHGQRPSTPVLLPTSEPLWTVRELAGFLQISPSTLYRMVDRGEVPAVRMGSTGRTVRFRRAAIEAWLKTHERDGQLPTKG